MNDKNEPITNKNKNITKDGLEEGSKYVFKNINIWDLVRWGESAYLYWMVLSVISVLYRVVQALIDLQNVGLKVSALKINATFYVV